MKFPKFLIKAKDQTFYTYGLKNLEHYKKEYELLEIIECNGHLDLPYWEWSIWDKYPTKGGFFLGEVSDSRGANSRKFYTCEEWKADAQPLYDKMHKESISRQNSYYSQLWV